MIFRKTRGYLKSDQLRVVWFRKEGVIMEPVSYAEVYPERAICAEIRRWK